MITRTRKIAGDTIVEVLIAMAVASAVMGGAYFAVNRSLANAQQAQEHGEALKLAQGQVERLSEAYRLNAAAMGSTFCLPSGSLTPASTTSSNCRDQGYDNRYDIIVTNKGSQTFEAKIQWDSATGSASPDTVTQVFKVVQL